MPPKEVLLMTDFEEVTKKMVEFLKKWYPEGYTIAIVSTNGAQIYNGSHSYKPDLKCLIK